ncbi:glycosyltransferase [Microbacterium immunditiarum]|uniref:Glycosyltransferase involved in cell wall biosynthesis n=1 Tax=Microbacterium immunditiarum TaxID=337480 RepID=A0A7Y9GQV1_9MICO|nr:glycosyltransferase involved in cell wall biosynthesis [Microbacterium immunditiarum]
MAADPEPVVTIVVPGFDVAEYAVEALDSLRRQTLREWIAILVDDASTDATPDLFAEAAASDPRYRVVRHETRRGLGAARNAGLDLVETPFVGFLDADDVLTERALERLVGTVSASGSDFACGAYVRLRPDGAGAYVPGDVQRWVREATSPARTATTIDQHPAASGNIVAWSKVSRTDFWRRAGLRFPEGVAYEDQLIAQRMYSLARAFDTIPDVVVRWRERADGTSITQRKNELPVLVDYLTAMREGIAVLDEGGHTAAAAARVRLILELDVPPLVRLAQVHPDDEYRRVLGDFVRGLVARAPEATTSTEIDAAALW